MSANNLRIQHQSKRLFVFAGIVSVLLTMTALVNQVLAADTQPKRAAGERLVSIYDGGIERTIVTRAGTVRQALAAAHITVNDQQDVIEPALETELAAEKYKVNIYRARPITVVDGALRRQR